MLTQILKLMEFKLEVNDKSKTYFMLRVEFLIFSLLKFNSELLRSCNKIQVINST